MILAVLEARCGVSLAQHDVYLNVAGGLKINEPAADLAVAAALLSSFSGIALPAQRVTFGEISLSGAVRTSSHMALRLKEAKKLGFTEAVVPAAGDTGGDAANLSLRRLTHLKELAEPLRACD
jgi:DNA repair protein RadA/Sms